MKNKLKWLAGILSQPSEQPIEADTNDGEGQGDNGQTKSKPERNAYSPLRVKVVTTCLETGAASERIIDHGNHQQRQWLGRHCYWAIRNNHSVLTTPL